MISIDEAISVSQRRAKRLWLLSVVWASVMVVLGVIFGTAIYQFNQTRKELNELKQTAAKLIADLQKTKDELSVLKKTGSVQSRHLYALSLQMLPPEKLTAEQKEFIRRQADENSSEGLTPDSLTVQAYSALIDRKFQDAYDNYTLALSLKADFGPAYAGRSLVDMALEDFAKANSDLTQALALDKDPTDRPILLAWRANALTRLGKIDDAKRDVDEANSATDPEVRAMALNDRGFIELKKKDWQGAEADFRAAAKLQPEQARSRLENIGIIYLFQSNWNKAYDWSVEVSKMPDKSGGWMWLIEALAAEKLGKSAERKIAFEQYLAKVDDPKTITDSLEPFLPDDLAQLAHNWVLQAHNK